MKWNSLLLLGIIILSFAEAHADPFEPASFPSLVTSLRIAAPLEFCAERVPLELQESRERLEKELLLSLWHRSQVILYLKRSRRYLPRWMTCDP